MKHFLIAMFALCWFSVANGSAIDWKVAHRFRLFSADGSNADAKAKIAQTEQAILSSLAATHSAINSYDVYTGLLRADRQNGQIQP